MIRLKESMERIRLVVSATNYTLDSLETKLKEEQYQTLLEITGRTKEEIIVRLQDSVSRKQLLEQLLQSDVDIEHFETYKPSLNDIFVAKVGEEA